ncbi:MAG: hypothetical protein AAGH15_05230 [Myxococcota bacterium]
MADRAKKAQRPTDANLARGNPQEANDTRDQRVARYIELKLDGETNTAIAKELDVSRRTIQRYAEDPDVQQAIDRFHHHRLQDIRLRLLRATDKGLTTLEKLCDAESTADDVKLEAARELLDRGLGKVNPEAGSPLTLNAQNAQVNFTGTTEEASAILRGGVG